MLILELAVGVSLTLATASLILNAVLAYWVFHLEKWVVRLATRPPERYWDRQDCRNAVPSGWDSVDTSVEDEEGMVDIDLDDILCEDDWDRGCW